MIFADRMRPSYLAEGKRPNKHDSRVRSSNFSRDRRISCWNDRCGSGCLAVYGDDQATEDGEEAAESLYEGHGVAQDEQGEDGGEERYGLGNGGHLPGFDVAQSFLLDEVAQTEVGDDVHGQDDPQGCQRGLPLYRVEGACDKLKGQYGQEGCRAQQEADGDEWQGIDARG